MVFVLVEAVGKMPFDVVQQVQEQVRIREKIESHLEKQNLEKKHTQVHSEQSQAQIRAETNAYRYNRFLEVQERVEQGKIIDIEV